MKKTGFSWRERKSNSEFIASVWACKAAATTTRTVLADPCISIALVRDGGRLRVVLMGPQTTSGSELLAAGYTCMAIRLQPGVLLKGFEAQRFINGSLIIPVDSASRFWFEGIQLRFPDFRDAELFVAHLHALGYIGFGASSDTQAAKTLSRRSYSRLIKRATGLSPYRLYQLQRMHQALRLLKQGLPAATVACELDFVDQSHLTHASRQFLGHTPKQLSRLPQIP